MNIPRVKRLVRYGVVLTGIVSAVIISASRIQAAASSSGATTSFSAPARPAGEHEFIIVMPKVDNVGIESLLTSASNITVSFVLTDGNPYSTTSNVLPLESMGIYTAPTGLSLSGEIGSDASGNTPPIFAVNFNLSNSGNSAYLGLNKASGFEPNCSIVRLTWDICIPLVVKAHDGATSRFAVRNDSVVAVGTIVVSFYDQFGNNPVSQTVGTVQPYGSFSVDLAGASGLPDDFVGSAVIVSDQQIEGASVSADGPTGINSDYRSADPFYRGPPLVAPALFAGHDLQTSELCIQNIFTSNQAVTVTYSDGLTRTAQIPAVATHCFDQGSEGHQVGWMGGAVISAANPVSLLGVVNVTDSISNTVVGRKVVGRWAYAVPAETQLASKAIALPLLLDDYPTGSGQGWTTSIYLYNPGASPAIVVPRYTSGDGRLVDCAAEITIPANGQVAISQPPLALTSIGYLTSTQPVAAVVSGTSDKPLGTTDRHFGYEAAYLDTPVTPQRACNVHQVYLPLIQR